MKCNGLEDLCHLRLDQITMPGSHNSGSGFDGRLHYSNGIVCSSCFYRNQGKSFSEQLEFGIRYFDIDTCYHNNEAMNCHCPGGGKSGKHCGYSGSIEKGLVQIDLWMKAHPSEVIMINFGRDVQGGYQKKIAKSIRTTLLKLWGPSKAGLKMSDHYRKNHGRWPTLKDAISSNKRIFILMHSNLQRFLLSDYWNSKWLLMSNHLVASTWKTLHVALSCSGIVTSAKAKCATRTTFLDLEAIGSYGLCTRDMAKVCSKWLGQAQQACYDKRKTHGKTVNILLVDWVSNYSGYESVVNKAKFMNLKNIANYLGKKIFFPEMQGCSKNYCWKLCEEYGWCWSNVYCGADEGICKRQSFECNGKCGY